MNNRLLCCAEFVRDNAKVCDVGTDHGYLACYLAKKDNVKSVIACDINEKPLKMAKKTVIENNLQDRVKLVLSDGLKEIDETNADDIIIAGMGGELILKIILECNYSKNSQKHFILQPMTQAPLLRKQLYKNGFEIIKEKAIYENKHHYSIMLCSYSGKKIDIDEVFAIAGKHLNYDNISSRLYCKHQIEKLEKIVNGLKKSNNKEDSIIKYKNIIKSLREKVF